MFLVTFMYSLFELEISVNFSAKLIIGKSADFSWDFCIYIGRKWFGLWVWIWVVKWVKVLILVGFDDIGGDIG